MPRYRDIEQEVLRGQQKETFNGLTVRHDSLAEFRETNIPLKLSRGWRLEKCNVSQSLSQCDRQRMEKHLKGVASNVPDCTNGRVEHDLFALFPDGWTSTTSLKYI